ncbi:MAG: Rrf2 family transcriptional regulator [Oscillospiraceae bacterium]|jgi:Rrf2 family protein|nr:Rrf2 family transcriptional regulator [Oscillospiraceae bacterium]
MRISAKGRYALCALMEIAARTSKNEPVSVISVAEKLGISKIFLEQTISQLKRAEILHSTKGKNGGYTLTRSPSKITVREVLFAVESALFEKTEALSPEESPSTAAALDYLLWSPLDRDIDRRLNGVSIQDLLDYKVSLDVDSAYMLNM